MLTTVGTRGVTLTALVALLVATPIAQSPGTTDADMSGVVAELRALRADLNRVAGANVRMQLLVARLTLQEQRIASLGREVVEVQGQVQSVVSNRSAVQARLQEIEEVRTRGAQTPEIDQDLAVEARRLARELAEQVTREQQLRGHESELLSAVSNEQSRWTEFSSRLDELERSLSGR